MEDKVKFYFELFHPGIKIEELNSNSDRKLLANKRYIEEELERIDVLYNHYVKNIAPKDIHTNEIPLEKLKDIYLCTKQRFFDDIFLDVYGNFVQKAYFTEEDQRKYDEDQEKMNKSLDFIYKHMDDVLVAYFIEIDNGLKPFEAANKAIEKVKKEILPFNAVENALHTTTTIQSNEAKVYGDVEHTNDEGVITND